MTDFSVSGSHTIMGAARFHGRVRDGVGWFPRAKVARRKGGKCDALGGGTSGRGPPTGLGCWRVKPHGRLVRVGCTRCRASTARLSTWWSTTDLQESRGLGRSHLGGGFPLRCFQRLSCPDVATRPCHWHDNRYTRGPSIPVLSYWEQRPTNLQRPRQIGTELSHDVLNPARVPL